MITVRRVAIASVMLALFAVHAIGNAVPFCAPPPGVVRVPLTQVPPILLQTLIDSVGEIVPPGASFDRTDVVMFGRNRRLAFFWKADSKWIVATEHGGLGYNNPVFLYHLDEGERNAVLLAEKIAFPNTLCAVASQLQTSP